MKISKISYESTVTVQVQGIYYKEDYREEVELDPEDDYEKELSELQKRVHQTVDDAISEIQRG